MARSVQQPATTPAPPRPLDNSQLPVAVFDDGDQHHHAGRALPLRLSPRAWPARPPQPAPGQPLPPHQPLSLPRSTVGMAAGNPPNPLLGKALRVSNPDGLYPDSYQAILPVVDMPKAGIVFPGSEFLQPSTTLTPAPPSTSPSTS